MDRTAKVIRTCKQCKFLQHLTHSAVKTTNGEGSTINVIDEAAIGKSRLMTEVKKAIKRRLLEGQVISIARNLGIYTIIDIIVAKLCTAFILRSESRWEWAVMQHSDGLIAELTW